MKIILPFFNKWSSYKKYLIELKYLCYYTILMGFLTICMCYLKIEPILYILSKYLLTHIQSSKFFFSEITQIFFSYIYISINTTIIICIPFILLNFFTYFLNSMFQFEFQIWKNIFFFFSFFYINLILIITLKIIPEFLKFFLSFEASTQYFPLYFEAKFETYFKLIFNFYYSILFFFQLLCISYYCFMFNWISLEFLIKKKKYIYLFIIFIIAGISPPEIASQILLNFFFISIFEFFIYFNFIKKYLFKI